jgi:uncharacterized protein (TIGR02266 family)
MDREFARIPLAVEVRFRTASSFLFAYSLNLSKGGLFLETETPAPVGTAITIKLAIPEAGSHEVHGHVSWIRDADDPTEGPRGMGVSFDAIDEKLGALIDELVTGFRGLAILLYSADNKDRAALSRKIRSIISTADVAEAGGSNTAEALMDDELDLVVVHTDGDDEGLRLVEIARTRERPLPTLVLSNEPDARAEARRLGAAEIASGAPSMAELQEVLLHVLGRPATVT